MSDHRKRILVVDDNSVNLEIIQEILGDRHDVVLAKNGLEALTLAAKCHPRVVLLDVMLPDMDGYQVCKRLRNMADVSRARIVMITAKAMPSERAYGFDAGADAYITKPFDSVDLVKAMKLPRGNELYEY